MMLDDKSAPAHVVCVCVHIYTQADNSLGYDGCPDAKPLQAQSR